MALTFASTASAIAPQPMAEMNTTPLIDVMLVLLIMFIITIPLATHSVDFTVNGEPTEAPIFDLKNKIIIDAQDRLFWNGESVTIGQMSGLLRDTRLMDIEPELQFEPDPMAGYAASTRALNTIDASGVTKFGFVGNEKYRKFGK